MTHFPAYIIYNIMAVNKSNQVVEDNAFKMVNNEKILTLVD